MGRVTDHMDEPTETIAHAGQNGRVTSMWNVFEGPPRILRVHGLPVLDAD